MRVHAKLSATCLGLALTLGSLWWSAASTYVVLHDDARFVGALASTLDQPAVRAQLGEWTGTAFDQASRLAGGKQTKAARQAVVRLQATVTSTAPLEPLITVVTGSWWPVGTRRSVSWTPGPSEDRGPGRRRAPAPPGRCHIDKKTAKAMGLTLEKGKRVRLPLFTGEQLDLLQRRYDLMVLVRQWAGWVALALLAVSVATSAAPLRTLAVAAGLVAVIALVLPHLLAYGQLRAADTQLGALVTPLLAAAGARVAAVASRSPWSPGLLAVASGRCRSSCCADGRSDDSSIESES